MDICCKFNLKTGSFHIIDSSFQTENSVDADIYYACTGLCQNLDVHFEEDFPVVGIKKGMYLVFFYKKERAHLRI